MWNFVISQSSNCVACSTFVHHRWTCPRIRQINVERQSIYFTRNNKENRLIFSRLASLQLIMRSSHLSEQTNSQHFTFSLIRNLISHPHTFSAWCHPSPSGSIFDIIIPICLTCGWFKIQNIFIVEICENFTYGKGGIAHCLMFCTFFFHWVLNITNILLHFHIFSSDFELLFSSQSHKIASFYHTFDLFKKLKSIYLKETYMGKSHKWRWA